MVWLALAVGFALLAGGQVYEYRQIESVRQDVKWTRYTVGLQLFTDELTPDVGTIQFLKKGYSIQLEGVNYTGDGLSLKGYVGNPTSRIMQSWSRVRAG